MKMRKIWEYGEYKLFQLQLSNKVLLILLQGENVLTTSYDWDKMINFIDTNIKFE